VKLVCPVCGSKVDMEQATHEELMHELVELAARFGRNWELVHEYVDCFRQEQWGSVTLKKRVRLTKEVWRLFEKNEFEYQGKRYRTDWTGVIAAITEVVNRDKFGFRNHNYLKSIMMKDAERVSAEGLTAKEEREKERQRREERGKRKEEKGISAEEWKKRQGIESLADMVGRNMEET